MFGLGNGSKCLKKRHKKDDLSPFFLGVGVALGVYCGRWLTGDAQRDLRGGRGLEALRGASDAQLRGARHELFSSYFIIFRRFFPLRRGRKRCETGAKLGFQGLISATLARKWLKVPEELPMGGAKGKRLDASKARRELGQFHGVCRGCEAFLRKIKAE